MNGKHKVLILSTLLAGMATAALAAAQPAFAPRGPVPFDVIDGNGDGAISAQEFEQHRDQRMAARRAQGRLLRNAGNAPSFSAWDSDGNGQLSPAELYAGQQARYLSRRDAPAYGGRLMRPCPRRW